jgi:beta-lactamase regulating signal transducer with metallopeptidase domain
MSFQFLVEMAWKSALISAVALALATLLRTRSAGERSALLGTAVALILALPVISALLPALTVVTGTVHEAAAPALSAAELASVASAPSAAPSVLDDPTPLIEWLWAGGVAMVLLRLGAGLWTLGRWTRTGTEMDCPAWRSAHRRATSASGCRRDVRLLVSDAPSPLSWGSLNPVVLIDRDTARDPGEADAVLAHELAHVARGDWVVLILARIAVALFWFNPLMWLLEREIVREAEEAADARALVHVEPARYAQTLLSCAQQQSALRLPASGMADAGLGRRVRAILERRMRAGAPDPRRIRTAVILAAVVAAPIAALKPVVAVVRSEPPAAPAAFASPASPSMTAHPPAPPAPAAGVRAPAQAPRAPGVPPVPPIAAVAPVPAVAAPPAPPRVRPLIDGEEIARNVQEAIAEAMAGSDEALREADAARAEAMRDAQREAARERGDQMREAMRDVARASREAARAGEQARIAARRGMAEGAKGMEHGAVGMLRGADHMEQEADRLGSREYREQQIARAAREGRTLTHQQLLDMIPRFRESARSMRAGAQSMRRSAERMRREG